MQLGSSTAMQKHMHGSRDAFGLEVLTSITDGMLANCVLQHTGSAVH